MAHPSLTASLTTTLTATLTRICRCFLGLATSLATKLKPYKDKIDFIAVGNEPLAYWYPASYAGWIVEAATNLQAALQNEDMATIKVTVPFQMGCLDGNYAYPPSIARFAAARSCHTVATSLLELYRSWGSAFTMNAYPLFAKLDDGSGSIPTSYATGATGNTVDGIHYASLLDAMYSSARAAVNRLGYSDIPLIIGPSPSPHNPTTS